MCSIDWVITFCFAANDRTPKRWISLTACTPNFHFAHWPPLFKNRSALSTIAQWAKKQLIKQTVQLMPYLSCQCEGFRSVKKKKEKHFKSEDRVEERGTGTKLGKPVREKQYENRYCAGVSKGTRFRFQPNFLYNCLVGLNNFQFHIASNRFCLFLNRW